MFYCVFINSATIFVSKLLTLLITHDTSSRCTYCPAILHRLALISVSGKAQLVVMKNKNKSKMRIWIMYNLAVVL